MKVYFVRHGETNWNKDRKIQGQTDIPLSIKGREDAMKLIPFFEQIKFDKVYSSPLCRARETAQIILNGRNGDIFYDERLKEISYGVDEGMPLPYIEKSPQIKLYNYFHAPERYLPPDEGEEIEELLVRCREFLKQLEANEQEGGHVLVCCHGAWIRGAILNVEHLEIKQFWEGNEQKNCAVTIMEYKNGKWHLLEDASVHF